MKLLFLIDSLRTGGAEAIVVNLANELSRSGRTIYLITTLHSDGAFHSELLPSVEYKHISCVGRNLIAGIVRLRRFVKEKAITHIHSHLYSSIILSRFLVWSDVKLLSTYHNLEYCPTSPHYSKWAIWLDKLTYKNKYVSLYVSEQVREVVQRETNQKREGYVVPNFAHPKFKATYKYSETNSLRLVSVGNLKRVKNFEFAIAAFKELRDFPVELHIYGSGHLYPSLSKRVNQENVHVFLKGHQENNPNIFERFDVYLMTSINEGMPISLLEAISYGMPCVLPDHLPVMKEVAAGAALYFSIDEPSSLSNKLLFLLENKFKLKEMSTIAVERSTHYSIQNHISTLLTIYRGK